MARIIEPKLRSWYWFRLDQDAVAYNTFKSVVLGGSAKINPTIALAVVSSVADGFREKTGNNDGLRVELAQQTVDGRAENEAYCMGEVQSRVAFVEIETGIKSKILPTEHCMTLYRDAKSNGYLVTDPSKFQPGDIILWKKGDTDSGHTGIFVKWIVYGKVMLVSEGNTTAGTGPNGAIVREGGGGYIVQRAVGQIGNMKLMGAARPFANYKP